MEYTTCFITGHRPHRFKFKYNEGYKLCIKIKKTLENVVIRQYIENDVRSFWVGVEIGVGCWVAEIILELKKQEVYCNMELLVALPFPKYDEKFDAKEKALWNDILKGCTDSVIVCKGYSVNAYQRRNYYMVDRSQYDIAVYDNDRSVRSGTGFTVHYAMRPSGLRKKGVQMRFIHPNNGKVIQQNQIGVDMQETM